MQQAPPLLRRRISFMEGDDYLNIDFQSARVLAYAI